jgi:hypothetical protein
VAVVLTLVQTKQIRIYIKETIQKHNTNNSKHNKYKDTYYHNTYTIVKTLTHTHTIQNSHIHTPTHYKTHTYTHHTLQNLHIHTPTHYKTHTYTHHTLQNSHIHTPTHYKTHTYTHQHITKPTHTHTHTLQNPHIHAPHITKHVKTTQYKIHTKWNSHNTVKHPQYKVTLMYVHGTFVPKKFTVHLFHISCRKLSTGSSFHILSPS